MIFNIWVLIFDADFHVRKSAKHHSGSQVSKRNRPYIYLSPQRGISEVFAGLDHVGILACLVGMYRDFRGCSVNWMEVCATSDGSGVVYAVGKPIKPQEKTRVSWTERPAGGRARACLQRTRNENIDSCAEIKSDMGISDEL